MQQFLAPLADTRPLPWADLTPVQARACIELGRLVGGMVEAAERARPRDGRAVDGVRLDRERTHRTLALSGPRGSGKSSVLLTTLQALQAAGNGAGPSLPPDEDEREVFRWLAPRVHVLPPLDFDPLPTGLPLLEAVVGAFKPRDEPRGAGGADRRGLNAAWRELHRLVVTGWDAAALRQGGRDLTEGVFDREEQLQGWLGFRDVWARFLDLRLESLPGRATTFLLAIDDADLQTERIAELLHVVRLLWDPRVVFLLVWDREHAEDMAKLSSWRELVRPGWDEPLTLHRDAEDWAWELARARMEKSAPVSAEVALPLLTLRDALEFGQGWLRGLLDRQQVACGWRGRLLPGRQLGEVLAAWPSGDGVGDVRLRALVQSQARLLRQSGGLPSAALFALLRDGDPDDMSTVAAPVRAEASAAGVVGVGLGGSVLVVLGGGERWVERQWIDQKEGKYRWRRARLPKLLFRELRHLTEPGGAEDNFFHGPHLAWSVVSLEDNTVEAIPWWPLAVVPRSYGEHRRLQGRWQELEGTNAESVGELAYRFVRLCLWSLDLPDVASPEGQPGPQAWDALLRHAAELADTAKGDSPREQATQYYVRFLLPLLAAPEYGLEDELRARILWWAVDRNVPPSGPSSWRVALRHARRTCLGYGIGNVSRAAGAWVPDGLTIRDQPGAVDTLSARLDEADRGLWRTILGGERWFGGTNPQLHALWSALVVGAGRPPRSFFRAGWDGVNGLVWAFQALDRWLSRTSLRHAEPPLRESAQLRGFPADRWAIGLWAAFLRAGGLPLSAPEFGWVVEEDRVAASGRAADLAPAVPGGAADALESGGLNTRAIPAVRPSLQPGQVAATLNGALIEHASAPDSWTWGPGNPGAAAEGSGLLALILLLQSGCELNGVRFEAVELDDAHALRVDDPSGAFPDGIPLPRFRAWASVEVARRRFALITAARMVLPSIQEADLRRWVAFEVLDAAIRSRDGNVAPPLQFHPVDAAAVRELAPALREALQDPVFHAWFLEVRPHLDIALGEAAQELTLTRPSRGPA